MKNIAILVIGALLLVSCGSAQSTSSQQQGSGDSGGSSAFARTHQDLPRPDLTKEAAAIGGGEKDAAVVAMERDWEKVKYLMGLQSYSVDDKKKVMRAFLRSYGGLSEQEPVRAANSAWEDFEAGRTPSIARIESAEQSGGASETGGVEWIYSGPAGIEFTKTEVTPGQFKQCVQEGGCKKDTYATKSDFKYCNWGYSDRDNHPMNCVNWHGADQFCRWLGGGARLPTEDEWYAEASNGGDRTWPWGDSPEVNCDYAIWVQESEGDYGGCDRDRTWPVCAKTKGNSVSGLCDMSGNVWEWTSSSEGSFRVLRGGSWVGDDSDGLRASGRGWGDPAGGHVDYGFRCVRSSH